MKTNRSAYQATRQMLEGVNNKRKLLLMSQTTRDVTAIVYFFCVIALMCIAPSLGAVLRSFYQ